MSRCFSYIGESIQLWATQSPKLSTSAQFSSSSHQSALQARQCPPAFWFTFVPKLCSVFSCFSFMLGLGWNEWKYTLHKFRVQCQGWERNPELSTELVLWKDLMIFSMIFSSCRVFLRQTCFYFCFKLGWAEKALLYYIAECSGFNMNDGKTSERANPIK